MSPAGLCHPIISLAVDELSVDVPEHFVRLWLQGGLDPEVDLFECFCDSFVMFFCSRVSRKHVVCNPCACLPGYRPCCSFTGVAGVADA